MADRPARALNAAVLIDDAEVLRRREVMVSKELMQKLSFVSFWPLTAGLFYVAPQVLTMRDRAALVFITSLS